MNLLPNCWPNKLEFSTTGKQLVDQPNSGVNQRITQQRVYVRQPAKIRMKRRKDRDTNSETRRRQDYSNFGHDMTNKMHQLNARFINKNYSKDQIQQNIAIPMRFTKKGTTFQIKCSPAIYDDFQILGTTLAFHCRDVMACVTLVFTLTWDGATLKCF